MAQIFHRSFNPLSKVSIFGTVFLLLGLGWAWSQFVRSDYVTGVGLVRDQPVPFSHQHHVAGLGIDCRYCHTSVENSSFAGIPSTRICMNCHNQIWVDSPMLEPVRENLRTGKSLTWNRVHTLPKFVYFDHSIHLKKGVGCTLATDVSIKCLLLGRRGRFTWSGAWNVIASPKIMYGRVTRFSTWNGNPRPIKSSKGWSW